MRKIVMTNEITLDGYFADEKDDISWHLSSKEFDRWAAETMEEFETLLLGRVTYDLFADFWPKALTNPKMSPEDMAVAEAFDKWNHVVISKSLKNPTWKNTKVLPEIDPDEIRKLKDQPGKDIVIYGSGSVVRQLSDLGLIDEYRFILAPVVLGKGRNLFEGTKGLELELIEQKVFETGGVVLYYKPV